jgi:ubiquinone/menaquinone biosynthesis C-methylase UbiE
MQLTALKSPSNSSSDAAEQQKLVDAYFQSAALYWKEIYQQEDLYARIHQQRQAMVLRLADKVGLLPESRVLEVGCGAGLTTVALAQRSHVVEAIDTVDAMIDLTRKLAVQAGLGDRIRASRGDVYHLAFPDHTFRLVLAIGVTPWLHSLNRPMQEMARVLEPRGHLIINADNRWSLRQMLDPWLNPALKPIKQGVRHVFWQCGLRQRPPKAARVHRCSLQEFDSLLSRFGLQKVEAMTLGFGPCSFFGERLLSDSTGIKIHQKLQSWADRQIPLIRSVGDQYLVLAKKVASHPEFGS